MADFSDIRGDIILELKRLGCDTREIRTLLFPMKKIRYYLCIMLPLWMIVLVIVSSLRQIQRIIQRAGSGKTRDSLEDVKAAIEVIFYEIFYPQ